MKDDSYFDKIVANFEKMQHIKSPSRKIKRKYEYHEKQLGGHPCYRLILLMFHGSCMTFDMYEKSIKIMAEKVHVIIPAITGHDLSIKEDFTSVEEVVRETEN